MIAQEETAGMAAEVQQTNEEHDVKKRVHSLVVELLEMFQSSFFRAKLDEVRKLSKMINAVRNFLGNIVKKNRKS